MFDEHNQIASELNEAIEEYIESENKPKRTWITYCFTCYPSSWKKVIFIWLFSILTFTFCMFLALLLQKWTMPTPKPKSIPYTEFSEERAYEYIDYLSNSIGPRVLGSLNNTICRLWILEQINTTIMESQQINNGYRIEITQQPFWPRNMNFTVPQYNILVRVSSEFVNSTKSVLVSSHFDSHLYSLGAGDDGIGVGTSLELFRNIISRPEPPKNPIIFFFNNGEEWGLLGAIAFVTNHSWAKRFINIDSMSGPGRGMLFRASPSSIASEYKVVPRPYASVIGEEIAHLIPSGTDYSVFVNDTKLELDVLKKMNGLDFAFAEWGFMYHTIKDTIQTFTPGGLQHLGDNVLALLHYYSEHIPENPSEDNSVYFDVGGIFFVHISDVVNLILQITLLFLITLSPIVLLSCFQLIYACIHQANNYKYHSTIQEARKNTTMNSTLFSTILIFFYLIGYIASFAVGIVLSILVALLISQINPQSWYSKWYISVLLYGFPCVLGIMLVDWIINLTGRVLCIRLRPDWHKHSFNRERFLAVLYFNGLFLLGVTIFRLRAAYWITTINIFIFGTVMFMLILDQILRDVYHRLSVKLDTEHDEDPYESERDILTTGKKKITTEEKRASFALKAIRFLITNMWIVVPVVTCIPYVLLYETFLRTLAVAIPTAGRAATLPGDLILAVTVAGFIGMSFIVFLPFIHGSSNHGKFCLLLLFGCIVIFIIAAVHHPYSEDSPKRLSFTNNWTVEYKVNPNGSLTEQKNHKETTVKSWDRIPVKKSLKRYENEVQVQFKDFACFTLNSGFMAVKDDYCNFTTPEILQSVPRMHFTNNSGTFHLNISHQSTFSSELIIEGMFNSVEIIPQDEEGVYTNRLLRRGISTDRWWVNLVPAGSSKFSVRLIHDHYELKYVPIITQILHQLKDHTIMSTRKPDGSISETLHGETVWHF